jgi:hypothetical protein
LSRVIRKAKIIEHDKLIKNSQKAKTTWGIINKESGRNKKRSEIRALNVEGKKITDKLLLKLLMIILLLLQKMLKDKTKNNFINLLALEFHI